MPSKWVFKHKKDEIGRIVRFKARLVAQGYTQVYGLDYLDTFTPVAKLASLRIILTIAATEDLELHQMDVVAAFLAGDWTKGDNPKDSCKAKMVRTLFVSYGVYMVSSRQLAFGIENFGNSYSTMGTSRPIQTIVSTYTLTQK